nr:RHS repeat-associated core domain-containing protein [uncultured Pseudomonas sp.]
MPYSLKILQRYVYDAIDRLSATGLSTLASTQRFYQRDHLVTELGEHSQRTIVRHEAQPLAQHEAGVGSNETTLFATDEAHSLLQTTTRTNSEKFAYTAYGHHPLESGLGSLLGFNGECPDTMTGHYLLGLGKRAFNPILMRFNSPDELSPFGEGGFNSYAYCANDPLNFKDPTANIKVLVHTSPSLSALGQRTRNFRPKKIMDPTNPSVGRLSSTASTSVETAAKPLALHLPPAQRKPRPPKPDRVSSVRKQRNHDLVRDYVIKFDRDMAGEPFEADVDYPAYREHVQLVEYSNQQIINKRPKEEIIKVKEAILKRQRNFKADIMKAIETQNATIRDS